MNPCPCGYLGHTSGKCRCTPDQITRYRGRLSGPLLDRIDIQIEVPSLHQEELLGAATGESSTDIQRRVDAAGLDAMDRRYLSAIAVNYGGGPVGVDTLAAALSEPRDAIEDIIEPYLIQCGFLQRTPRGRLITAHAFRHLGLPEPARDPAQFGLFAAGEDT